jgi:hypothetical protein
VFTKIIRSLLLMRFMRYHTVVTSYLGLLATSFFSPSYSRKNNVQIGYVVPHIYKRHVSHCFLLRGGLVLGNVSYFVTTRILCVGDGCCGWLDRSKIPGLKSMHVQETLQYVVIRAGGKCNCSISHYAEGHCLDLIHLRQTRS